MLSMCKFDLALINELSYTQQAAGLPGLLSDRHTSAIIKTAHNEQLKWFQHVTCCRQAQRRATVLTAACCDVPD